MAETTELMIQSYEKSLRENSNKPLSNVFFSYSKKQNHEEACALFRYVFEKILDWKPYDIVNYLSYELIEELNLKKAFANLIYPPEYKERKCAPFYVAVLCYPDIIKEYKRTNLWIMEYNSILHKGRGNFVSFDSADGYDKARFLLNYYLVNSVNQRFKDLETAYAFFASPKAVPFLKEIRLLAACEQFFLNPLEYFHAALADDVGEESSKSDLLLQFTEYKALDNKLPVFELSSKKRGRRRASEYI